jgi:hypothetical protein
MSSEADLSGKKWWKSNQSKFPNSNDIDALEPSFGESVRKFLNVLKESDVKVKIASTRRNEIRAYLMKYCWDIANDLISPEEVPKKAGVNIEWNHGEIKKSQDAAQEMVEMFNLVHRPSLGSNHIKGLAIDMTISWKKDLFLGKLPDGSFRGVSGGPKNGAKNKDLHEIGELFGVRKLLNDAPHWSYNGK